MAAIVSGPYAFLVVPANHSSYGAKQRQQNSSTILNTSSHLSPHRVLTSPGSSVTRLGFLSESRSQPQLSRFIKPNQAYWFNNGSGIIEADADPAEDTLDSVDSPRLEISGGDSVNTTGFPSELSGSDSLDTSRLPSELSGSDSLDTSGLPSEFSDAAPDSAADALLNGDIPSDNAPSLFDGMDSFSSPGSGVGKPGLSTTERYRQLTQGGYRAGGEESNPADNGDTFKSVQDSIDLARESAANSVNDFVTSITSTVDSVTSGVRGAIDSAINGARDTFNSATASVKKSVDSTIGSVNESISGSVDSVTGSYEKSVEDIKSNVEVDFGSVFRVGSPANNVLKDIVTAVKTATASVLGTAGDVIVQTYYTAKGNVPEEIQSLLNDAEEKTSRVTSVVGSVFDQVVAAITSVEKAVGIDPENPVIAVVLFVGGSVFVVFSYFNSRYGGYAGDLLPTAALDLLKKEKNAVLVDIRPQESRETEGIPDLRRSIRAKFATVEICKVEGPDRKLIRNVNAIEPVLTAAIIGNLKNVKKKSKVIVMDLDGGESKQIARDLRKSGIRRAYRVDGGFKAWASAGLKFKLERPETPLSILQEDAEALVEEVKPTPLGVTAVLIGCVTGTFALIQWETSLQYIGLIGLGLQIYKRVASYETVEDAKADLRLAQRPFIAVTQAFGWVGGQLEPKKLQLATSPSSSAVQGRVIQAAAKHGPIASELELVPDEPEAEAEPKPEPEPEVAPEVEVGLEVDNAVPVAVEESSQSQHTSVQESQES